MIQPKRSQIDAAVNEWCRYIDEMGGPVTLSRQRQRAMLRPVVKRLLTAALSVKIKENKSVKA